MKSAKTLRAVSLVAAMSALISTSEATAGCFKIIRDNTVECRTIGCADGGDCDNFWGCKCTLCGPNIHPVLGLEAMTMSLNLNRTGGSGSFYTVNSQYSAVLHSAQTASIQNYDDWGSAIDSGIAPSEVGVTLVVQSHPDPTKRTMAVSSLYARIPSFVHSHSSPDATGNNELNLYSGGPQNSSLVVDMSTGALSGVIYATLVNSHYDAASPILAELHVTGQLNPSGMSMSVSVLGKASAQ
jgi:hypothetical protein